MAPSGMLLHINSNSLAFQIFNPILRSSYRCWDFTRKWPKLCSSPKTIGLQRWTNVKGNRFRTDGKIAENHAITVNYDILRAESTQRWGILAVEEPAFTMSRGRARLHCGQQCNRQPPAFRMWMSDNWGIIQYVSILWNLSTENNINI